MRYRTVTGSPVSSRGGNRNMRPHRLRSGGFVYTGRECASARSFRDNLSSLDDPQDRNGLSHKLVLSPRWRQNTAPWEWTVLGGGAGPLCSSTAMAYRPPGDVTCLQPSSVCAAGQDRRTASTPAHAHTIATLLGGSASPLRQRHVATSVRRNAVAADRPVPPRNIASSVQQQMTKQPLSARTTLPDDDHFTEQILAAEKMMKLKTQLRLMCYDPRG